MKIEDLIQRVNDRVDLPEDYRRLFRTLCHAIAKKEDGRVVKIARAMDDLRGGGEWVEVLHHMSRMGLAVSQARISIRSRARDVMAEGVYGQLRLGPVDYYGDIREQGLLTRRGWDVLALCDKHLNWAERCYQIEGTDWAADHVLYHLDDHMCEGMFDEVSVALDCLDPTKMNPTSIGAALTITGRSHERYDEARKRFVQRTLDAGFEELVQTLGAT